MCKYLANSLKNRFRTFVMKRSLYGICADSACQRECRSDEIRRSFDRLPTGAGSFLKDGRIMDDDTALERCTCASGTDQYIVARRLRTQLPELVDHAVFDSAVKHLPLGYHDRQGE